MSAYLDVILEKLAVIAHRIGGDDWVVAQHEADNVSTALVLEKSSLRTIGAANLEVENGRTFSVRFQEGFSSAKIEGHYMWDLEYLHGSTALQEMLNDWEVYLRELQ